MRPPLSSACAAALVALTLTGCARNGENSAVAGNNTIDANVAVTEDIAPITPPANVAVALPTDDWVGRWTGPEGLFLDIQPSPDGRPGHYAIVNKDTLDRQGDYSGTADGATIRFVRDGKDMVARPGTGDETGFKYLAGKQDCLIVVPGQEGYCR